MEVDSMLSIESKNARDMSLKRILYSYDEYVHAQERQPMLDQPVMLDVPHSCTTSWAIQQTPPPTSKPQAWRLSRLWTLGEDQLLRDSVRNHGGKGWKGISDDIPDKNEKQCRDRWSNYLDPTTSRQPWTFEEDQQLQFYNFSGRTAGQWAWMARRFPGRTSNAVRSRSKYLRKHHVKAMQRIE